MPKKPNLKNHADIEIIITALMPYLFKKNGISNMQRVSEICDREISMLACSANNES